VGRTKKAAEQQAAEAAWRAITAEAAGDVLGSGNGASGHGDPPGNGEGPDRES
jgi:membrane protein involved in colicin uptake